MTYIDSKIYLRLEQKCNEWQPYILFLETWSLNDLEGRIYMFDVFLYI